jgi:hypothetical protein
MLIKKKIWKINETINFWINFIAIRNLTNVRIKKTWNYLKWKEKVQRNDCKGRIIKLEKIRRRIKGKKAIRRIEKIRAEKNRRA